MPRINLSGITRHHHAQNWNTCENLNIYNLKKVHYYIGTLYLYTKGREFTIALLGPFALYRRPKPTLCIIPGSEINFSPLTPLSQHLRFTGGPLELKKSETQNESGHL